MKTEFSIPTIALDRAGSILLTPASYLFKGRWIICLHLTKETSVNNKCRCTAKKIFIIFLSILFFIPGMLIGIPLKCIALLCSKNLRTQYVIVSKRIPHIRVKGSQAECHGPIDIDLAQKISTHLQKHAPPGIKFSSPADTETSWNGGTCGAMSFAYIDQYLENSKTLTVEKAVLVTANDSRFFNSSKFFRTQQISLSRYIYDPTSISEPIDITLNKEQGFINLYNRKITFASEIMDLTSINTPNKTPAKLTQNERAFAKMLKKKVSHFANGAYLVNAWLASDTHPKRQERGHQMVYIKDNDKEYYYDPNKGTHELGPRDPNQRTLFRAICNPTQMFRSTRLRFYKIE